MLDVEGENLTKKDVLREVRKEFGVKGYQVMPVMKTLKQRFVPKKILE